MSFLLLKDEYNVDQTFTEKWAILDSITFSFTYQWNIVEAIQEVFTFVWSVLSYFTTAFTYQWDLGAYIYRQFQYMWDVSRNFSGKVIHSYKSSRLVRFFGPPKIPRT